MGKDLQQMVDDEVQGRDDARDAAIRADRRANELAVSADENRVALESAVRAAKAAESEKVETSDRLAELQAMYNNAANGKRKAENDFHALQEEVEELENDAKASEDKAARAMAEVARLISELNNASEGTGNAEKSRALLAKQVADLQVKLEESESGGGRGVKAQIRKLEQRIMELESDLDTEARKSADVLKQARKADKRVKEVEFALDDERKASEKAHDGLEKMNSKMKNMRLSSKTPKLKSPPSKPNTRKPHSNSRKPKRDAKPLRVHSRRPARELRAAHNRWPPPVVPRSGLPANDPACERHLHKTRFSPPSMTNF